MTDHKRRNQNLSHITTEYISNSPSQGLVRADQAVDGQVSTSIFNYANVTEEGFVDNTLTTYSGNSTKPDVWRGYVNSNFPLFAADILVTSGAVFGGLVQRPFVHGLVASVRTRPSLPSTTDLSDSVGTVADYVSRRDSGDSLCEQLQRHGWVRVLFARAANPGGYQLLQHRSWWHLGAKLLSISG